MTGNLLHGIRRDLSGWDFIDGIKHKNKKSRGHPSSMLLLISLRLWWMRGAMNTLVSVSRSKPHFMIMIPSLETQSSFPEPPVKHHHHVLGKRGAAWHGNLEDVLGCYWAETTA